MSALSYPIGIDLLEQDFADLQAPSGAKPDFDYNDLGADVRPGVLQIAQNLRELIARRSKDLLTMGSDLRLAKQFVGHGRFANWLRSEFGWSERTAERYMRAFDVFGSKNDTVSVLEPTVTYALSAKSTPSAVREEVLNRVAAGTPPALHEIRTAVASARRVAADTRRIEKQAKDLSVPIAPPISRQERSRAAAAFISEKLGPDSAELSTLLENVDPVEFLLSFRKHMREISARDDRIVDLS